MKTNYHTSNKKGYVDSRNAEKNPQAEYIQPAVIPTVDYGSPAMSPMPKSVEDWGKSEGHKDDIQRPSYPHAKHGGDYKPLVP